MSCNYPVPAWRAAVVPKFSKTGRRPLVFKKALALAGSPEIQVPCQMCTGCRMERARQWAMRCMHEKRMHSESAFLTLTYSQANLPYLENGLATLVLQDVQLFMKRLRHARPSGLRFFMCGEYGETTQRPHYHVLMLNTSFPDMKFHKRSRGGKNLFASAELDGVWKLGDCLIGEVSYESCGYVAGYQLKQQARAHAVPRSEAAKLAAEAFWQGRKPPFIVMSRNPGLGFEYYEKYKNEICAHDSVVVSGREVSAPKYYDTLRARDDLGRLEAAKRLRRKRAREKAIDNTNWRMHHKELFLKAKQRFFQRGSEV